ncbi:hypothetical protein V8E54_008484 [Elaphomyces granulatus]|jgi:hypothetical protein
MHSFKWSANKISKVNRTPPSSQKRFNPTAGRRQDTSDGEMPDYSAHQRTAILSDADVIGGLEMILQGQTNPPAGSNLEAIWNKKNEILRCRIIQSFSSTVRTQMNLIDENTASALFERIARDYGKSLAEERLMLSKELKEMKIENNDYLAYMRKVNSIRQKYAALECPLDENILHDFFILGLGNWQSYFIKNKLDKFYSTKRDGIQNLNIDA